uniref:Uncharacterized protein n=1 Tax=Gadus morhua TaxID=8049 RepID=A0A8C4ZAN3_GADMO
MGQRQGVEGDPDKTICVLKSLFDVTNNKEAADEFDNDNIDFLEYVASLNRVLRGMLDPTLLPAIWSMCLSPHIGELYLDAFMDRAGRDKWVSKRLRMDLNLKDWMKGPECSADFSVWDTIDPKLPVHSF